MWSVGSQNISQEQSVFTFIKWLHTGIFADVFSLSEVEDSEGGYFCQKHS